MPQRIQLRRTKGWRKPEGAIVVARPSRWGNPFVLRREYGAVHAVTARGVLIQQYTTRADALAVTIKLYRHLLIGWHPSTLPDTANFSAAYEAHRMWQPATNPVDLARSELAGHDLACWCPLDQPCHADVLLELANQ